MEAQLRENRILDFDGFPGKWEIRETTKETDGERFVTHIMIKQPGKLPTHKHPMAEESYKVLSGKLEVYQNRKWEQLNAGEQHTVPAGEPHAFRTDGFVEMINVHKPALRYEEYFRRFHKLKTELGVQMPPKSLGGMIRLGMLQANYEQEFIGVNPPQWFYKFMSGLGRLLGYRLLP